MGKVSVNRTVRKNPEFPVIMGRDIIIMDDVSINQAQHVYIMLNTTCKLLVRWMRHNSLE